MITLYLNYIVLSSCVGNGYGACIAIPLVLLWDFIFAAAIIDLCKGKNKKTVYVKTQTQTGNKGYESVDWNDNGKIDYWEL